MDIERILSLFSLVSAISGTVVILIGGLIIAYPARRKYSDFPYTVVEPKPNHPDGTSGLQTAIDNVGKEKFWTNQRLYPLGSAFLLIGTVLVIASFLA